MLFQNCFPSAPLGPKRKFITLWSKFKTVPSLKHLKSLTGRTDPSPLKLHMSLIELQTRWEEMCRETLEGGVSPYSVFLLSIYLSSEWNSSSDARERRSMRARAAELELLDRWGWMEDLSVTWSGEENTCSAGLGSLDTCGEGWEFLQRERWGEGRMEKVGKEEEEASACLWCSDINLEMVLAYCSFVRWHWYLVGKGWII